MHVRRTPYVAILALVTGALTVGYLLWSDTTGFVLQNWWWGLVGAALSGFVAIVLLRRAPTWRKERAPVRIGQLLWEGVVYGTAEALLLSILPVLVTWQALDGRGWLETTGGTIGAGAIALAASVLVIVVHHLGYRAFRGRQVMFAVLGCIWFSLAYLLTGSPIGAAGGHVAMHGAADLHAFELPPFEAPRSFAMGPGERAARPGEKVAA